jgi:hypothetical protein
MLGLAEILHFAFLSVGILIIAAGATALSYYVAREMRNRRKD